ncbi:ankyrin repeat domain-containing protein 10 [Caerostris extrusa]|uniref:Ankyrin repeat domain-containing protein 10 n=1 Tax=Caerostris extrusa TaxID=172846 RepID=A0AAV4U0U0_CAEEX|nr:ankyrin repeat domain-containing protein 10 [Caerostris extrusa]
MSNTRKILKEVGNPALMTQVATDGMTIFVELLCKKFNLKILSYSLDIMDNIIDTNLLDENVGAHGLKYLKAFYTEATVLPLDVYGESALHKAAKVGNAECASLLIEVSDNIRSQNLNGHTASAVAQMNGFIHLARFIYRREEASLNAFQNRQIMPLPRMSRKRLRDAVCDEDVCKRLRGDDLSLDAPNSMTTSLYEHNSLCNIDVGYQNVLYEFMLSEYHGC